MNKAYQSLIRTSISISHIVLQTTAFAFIEDRSKERNSQDESAMKASSRLRNPTVSLMSAKVLKWYY